VASRYFSEGSISDIEPSYLKRSRKEIRSVAHTLLGRHFRPISLALYPKLDCMSHKKLPRLTCTL
jgi:hypothetical protein